MPYDQNKILRKKTAAVSIKNTQFLLIKTRYSELLKIILGIIPNKEKIIYDRLIGLSLKNAPKYRKWTKLALLSHKYKISGENFRYVLYLFYKNYYNFVYSKFKKFQNLIIICWNGSKKTRIIITGAAKTIGLKVLYLERSPIPRHIQADFSGVNFGNSLPRKPEFYLHWQAKNNIVAETWRDSFQALTARQPIASSKVKQQKRKSGFAEGKFIFCPLQVPHDTQIVLYGGWVRSIEHFLNILDQATTYLPDGFHIRIKEHPSSKRKFARIIQKFMNKKIILDNETETFSQVRDSHAVITINSSVGIQSFYYRKPVITLGKSFYSFGGMCHKADDQKALNALLGGPARLSYNSDLRDAFMNYVVKEYFPLKEDVIAGRYTIHDVIARDARRDAILAEIDREQ